MPKKRIVFFELEDWEKKYFKQKLKSFDIKFIDDNLTEKNAFKAANADIVGIFIFSKINKSILEKLPNLKLITALSTGFDHIDLKACKERKIKVTNVPAYGENTVAEHTMALILNLTRKIHIAWERTSHLDFSTTGLRGIDLLGKTIGVVGTGNIGQHVIRMAKGFEMNVIAFDIFKKDIIAKKLGFKYVNFDNLLKNSDIISLHVPYNKHTHHLINKKNLKKMKKDAIIINTARGGLIETEALCDALEKGNLRGAGLDVLEEECMIKEDKQVMSKHFPKKCDMKIIIENNKLAKMNNVIITPHNAFNSIEALERILETTIESIKSFKKGKIINSVG
tara:strand:- start:27620 stop:28630 length:1011 start_codon:yes stop_codon:yes gene_type:complete